MLSPLAPLLLITALISSSYALVTPHARDITHRHHGLAARIPLVAPDAEAQPQRRRFRKRCLSRPDQPSSATVQAASSTQAPVAVAPAPATSAKPESSKAPDPPKASDPPKDDGDNGNGDNNGGDNGGNNGGNDGGNTGGDNGGDNSGGGGEAMSGDGTFYDTGLGACGITNVDTDFIAAVAIPVFDNYPGYTGGNPNNNPICGKKVTAHYQGKSVTVTITDRCGGCARGDLDFSPAAFRQLADQSLGRINPVTWTLP